MQFEQSEQRTRALDATLKNLDKRFGTGILMRLTDDINTAEATLSTGLISLDFALGCGGWPKGRLIEIFGPESSGKTTLTLQAISQVQNAGGTAAFIDAEHALDVSYAKKLGVNLDELLISQPDSGEQALEVTEALVRSGAVDLVVVDSVAALVPQAELEGDMGDAHVGLQARLMSQALRKLAGAVRRSGTIVIFVNQVRQKIGVTFGNGEVTTGGNALKFYASVRIDIRRIGSVKGRDEVLGNKTRIRVVKNKLAPPFRSVETEIRFGEGICPVSDLISMAESYGALNKNGSWYSYGDERLGQGRDQARATLLETPDLRSRIEQDVRGRMGLSLAEGPIPEAK
ncbi:MAG: recombinase RecA [Deltaproteobacteria bacterium]|nr:MAG: recombinase RecA [Deltaproteobacteria bacterium]